MKSLKAEAALAYELLNPTLIAINAKTEWISNTTIKTVNESSSIMNHLWFLYPRQLSTNTQWWSNF
jgi:hypothetical protein